LPDESAWREKRRRAIGKARDIVLQRRDRIDEESDRKSYLNRSLNSQILNVAKLIGGEEPEGDDAAAEAVDGQES
jgi:hypothetical protein